MQGQKDYKQIKRRAKLLAEERMMKREESIQRAIEHEDAKRDRELYWLRMEQERYGLKQMGRPLSRQAV